MSLSHTQKLVLVLLTIAYIFSTSAEANRGWGWGWGSNQTGFGWNWGWGSNHSAGSGSGSNWGWAWGSNHSGGSGSGSGSGSWGWWGSHNPNSTDGPRKIVVGGSAGWQYGFNYADWASKNAPFYVDDILVFKYNPPAPFTHSVYLLPDVWSYMKCDVKKGKMIAKTTQGAGEGFEFALKKWQPYYFACGEHDGIHCNNGTMKFTVVPMLRRW